MARPTKGWRLLTEQGSVTSGRPLRFGHGDGWMFAEHILQARRGCVMDFLQTQFGETAGEPDIF